MKYRTAGPQLMGATMMVVVFISQPILADAGVNPYQAISDRNPFGLRPPAAVSPPEQPKLAASKIKLQGITSILGRLQVLFKASIPARPPEPTREASYVLSQGQREGDIEVVAIDNNAGVVKFNNAGIIEVLSMDKDAEKPAAGPAVVAPAVPAHGTVPKLPGVPTSSPTTPPQIRPTTGTSPLATFGGQQRTIPTRTLRTDTTGGANAANIGGFGNVSGRTDAENRTPQPHLSREEQAALMLLNKEKWKQLGREDIANLIPNPIPQQTPTGDK